MSDNLSGLYAGRPALHRKFEQLRQYFADAEPALGVEKDALFAAIDELQATRPPLTEITPHAIAAAADRLLDRYRSRSERTEAAQRKLWSYVTKIIWVPRRISPQDIAGLLENGFSSRQISALAQWVAARTLLIRRAAGVAAIEAYRAARKKAPSTALVDLAGIPSDLTREQFATKHAAAIGAWHPWIDYEEDGYDWKGNFDQARQGRTTFRITASDRELAKLLASIEDEIFVADASFIIDGLAKSGRELSALVTSVENGCGYCTASHVKGFVESGGSPRHALDLVTGQRDADFGQPTAALIGSVRTLNNAPSQFSETSVTVLADAGLSDLAILDLVHSAAYFNYANRVLIALGGYRGGE